MTTPLNILLKLLKTHIAYTQPNTVNMDVLLKLHGEVCELLSYERDVMSIVFYDGEMNQFNVNKRTKYYETATNYLDEKFKTQTADAIS